MVAEKENINSIAYMKKICTIMENKMNTRLKELNLTRAQFEIIAYILRTDEKVETQRNIEKMFGLSHTTVIGILKRLEKNGFVEIKIDLKDRRQRNVYLTQKALDLERDVMRIHTEINEYFVQKFSPEQIELFESAIKVFYEILVENNINL